MIKSSAHRSTERPPSIHVNAFHGVSGSYCESSHRSAHPFSSMTLSYSCYATATLGGALRSPFTTQKTAVHAEPCDVTLLLCFQYRDRGSAPTTSANACPKDSGMMRLRGHRNPRKDSPHRQNGTVTNSGGADASGFVQRVVFSSEIRSPKFCRWTEFTTEHHHSSFLLMTVWLSMDGYCAPDDELV